MLKSPHYHCTGDTCLNMSFELFVNQWDRIADNAHLLDATEIFRKLNVHKKVFAPSFVSPNSLKNSHWRKLHTGEAHANAIIGIIFQAWFPLGYVLLLPLFDDR